jgi:aspartate carbamoyltransferase regulatory subunit
MQKSLSLNDMDQLGDVETMATFNFIKDGKVLEKIMSGRKNELERKVGALAYQA